MYNIVFSSTLLQNRPIMSRGMWSTPVDIRIIPAFIVTLFRARFEILATAALKLTFLVSFDSLQYKTPPL